ncbi:MAG: ABC transporter ATP-binding protein [Syntrophomonadaceae bacterium]|nr:ABC transporter ATP-binding protein [Syntrophomonadaceae bacterium]
MIDVIGLVLKYSNGKGIFDLNFSVDEGEVMGYLGPNGAGKTTTIRALLGFMQPNSGTCLIGGLDCTDNAPEIQKTLGYIPGEIAFLDGMNGNEFLKFMNDMRNTKDLSRQNQLIEMFELDTKGKIKKFSKGMKQKLGIVTAFMHNPSVLILDEPTSGLDPLMQNRFVELIMEEKKKGKTILMSSHRFEEIERTCDNVLIIKDGRIVEQSDVHSLKNKQRRGFIIKPQDITPAILALKSAGFEVKEAAYNTIEVFITGEDVDRFIKTVAQFTILNFDVKNQSLEDIFMKFYGREGK